MSTPITKNYLEELIEQIQYKDWKFNIMEKGDGFLIQPIFTAPDQYTKEPEVQACRKWYVSAYSCDSEIIRTCFLAIQQAEMHELSENFMFRGQRIFNPHLNLKLLSGLCAGQCIRNQRNPGKTIMLKYKTYCI